MSVEAQKLEALNQQLNKIDREYYREHNRKYGAWYDRHFGISLAIFVLAVIAFVGINTLVFKHLSFEMFAIVLGFETLLFILVLSITASGLSERDQSPSQAVPDDILIRILNSEKFPQKFKDDLGHALSNSPTSGLNRIEVYNIAQIYAEQADAADRRQAPGYKAICCRSAHRHPGNGSAPPSA